MMLLGFAFLVLSFLFAVYLAPYFFIRHIRWGAYHDSMEFLITKIYSDHSDGQIFISYKSRSSGFTARCYPIYFDNLFDSAVGVDLEAFPKFVDFYYSHKLFFWVRFVRLDVGGSGLKHVRGMLCVVLLFFLLSIFSFYWNFNI